MVVGMLIAFQLAVVDGRVVDSLAADAKGRGARVRVERVAGDSALAREVTANDDGRFRLDSLPAGRWRFSVIVPTLDSLGVDRPGRELDLRAGKRERVTLVIPSYATLSARLCGGRGGRAARFDPRRPTALDSTTYVMGGVRDAESGALRGGASIQFRWTDWVLAQRGIVRDDQMGTISANDHGWYSTCGVPVGGELRIRAMAGSDTSGWIVREFSAATPARLDLFVGKSVPAAVDSASVTDTAATWLLGHPHRGEGRLAGVVRGAGGRPLPGAIVAMWGATARSITDSAGRFVLDSLPGGSQTLDVRAQGFAPERRSVAVFTGAAAESLAEPLEIALVDAKTYLDTVKVTATRAYTSDSDGFERRRRTLGYGRFLDRETIARTATMYTSDALRMFPGVHVRQGQWGPIVLFPGPDGGYCRPALFIDGMRFTGEMADLDLLTQPLEVDAMEIYNRNGITPAQYTTLEGCGSIVVWRRRGR